MTLQADRRAKQQKQLEHQFNKIKIYKKEIQEEEKKAENTIQARENKQKEINLLKKKGVIKGKRRVSGINYKQQTPEFQLIDEMPSNLRELKSQTSLLADQMDTIYRKKYVEIDDRKHQKSKIKKRKYYNADREP